MALLSLLHGCPAHPPDTGGWAGRWLILLTFDTFPECPHTEPAPPAVIRAGASPCPQPHPGWGSHLEMKSAQDAHSNRQPIPRRGTMKPRR